MTNQDVGGNIRFFQQTFRKKPILFNPAAQGGMINLKLHPHPPRTRLTGGGNVSTPAFASTGRTPPGFFGLGLFSFQAGQGLPQGLLIFYLIFQLMERPF